MPFRQAILVPGSCLPSVILPAQRGTQRFGLGLGETDLEFGELKNVTLCEVWGNEANNFTPWLAANIERLSKAIGVPMELEGSDRTHLGQILTYLAGVQAQTVIWIARDFSESH